jgi:hypothetical protein
MNKRSASNPSLLVDYNLSELGYRGAERAGCPLKYWTRCSTSLFTDVVMPGGVDGQKPMKQRAVGPV